MAYSAGANTGSSAPTGSASRTTWTIGASTRPGGRVLDEPGLHGDKWDEVRLDVPRFEGFSELEGNQAVVDATIENRPLVSRTELEDEEVGRPGPCSSTP